MRLVVVRLDVAIRRQPWPDGLAPAVRIPPDVHDELAYVRGYLSASIVMSPRAQDSMPILR